MKNAFILWMAFMTLLIGAGPAVAAKAETSEKTAQTAKSDPGRPETSAAAAEAEEEGYRYDPEGKTDPFDAFIVQKSQSLSQVKQGDVSGAELQKMLALLEDLKRPKTELQTIPLEAIKLTSIVKTGDRTVAMVKGPEGGKGYMLKKGTYIGKNGGVVQEIINAETMTDLGKQLVRKVVIREPYLTKQRKIDYRNVELKMPGSFD